MDATPEAFAYRCLPLNIANAHGWEILAPCDATAYWTGRGGTEDVIVRLPPRTAAADAPVSLFGQGVLTFHIQGLFRTPPGWDLWVGGSPNRPKDGIYPLSGVIETDWSPYTFTMNWRFTRRNRWVSFRAGEPICFVFPLQRGALERFAPKLAPLDSNPALAGQFEAWSRSRAEFQASVAANAPATPSEKWQKRYYRGVTMTDRPGAADHRAKLRLKPFVPGVPDADGAEAVRLDLTADALAEGLAAIIDSARKGDAAEMAAQLSAIGVSKPIAGSVAARVVDAALDRPGVALPAL